MACSSQIAWARPLCIHNYHQINSWFGTSLCTRTQWSPNIISTLALSQWTLSSKQNVRFLSISRDKSRLWSSIVKSCVKFVIDPIMTMTSAPWNLILHVNLSAPSLYSRERHSFHRSHHYVHVPMIPVRSTIDPACETFTITGTYDSALRISNRGILYSDGQLKYLGSNYIDLRPLSGPPNLWRSHSHQFSLVVLNLSCAQTCRLTDGYSESYVWILISPCEPVGWASLSSS